MKLKYLQVIVQQLFSLCKHMTSVPFVTYNHESGLQSLRIMIFHRTLVTPSVLCTIRTS